MHTVDLERMVQTAKKKVDYQLNFPLGYVVLAILAGVYLGFGITLIFSVGAPFAAEESAAVKLVMGASFGIALTLVIFAGSELFTGNNMICTIGTLSKEISWAQLSQIFIWSFLGNLAGSIGISWLVAQSGVLAGAPQINLLMKVAATKMSLPAWDLFLRGILCNWLVCLAVWMAMRTTNEVAKLLLIFWCLFAFVGSSFEHSIANQSILAIALFLPHGADVTWAGLAWNQLWVVLGNTVGGALFMGGAYWLTSPLPRKVTEPSSAQEQSVVVLDAQGLRG